ncbi:MAG: hypothetical protein ACPG4N_01975 [Gammaproteobacteria bacterium]
MSLALVTCSPVMAEEHWMPDDCRVKVTGNGAELIFPAVYETEAWTWFQSDTQDDSLEYSFEVLLRSGEHTRGLGFYLFKLGGMHPVVGDTNSFIQQGKVMVWTKVNRGRRLVPVEGVEVTQRDKRIILKIKDTATMRALFGSNPRAALFSTLHPDPKFTYGCIASVPEEARRIAQNARY